MNIELDNIETLFSLIEMGKLISRFPGYEREKISKLHEAIHRFIIRTIELKTNFIYKENEGYSAPEAYGLLVQNIALLEKNHGMSSSSILTFNYDIAIDHALELAFGNNDINYCLDESKQRIEHGRYKLLKLHGSINWAKHKSNEHVKVIPVGVRDFIAHSGMPSGHSIKQREKTFLTTRDIHRGRWIAKKDIHFEVGSRINKLEWFLPNEKIEGLPLIVPPTWSKTEYHPILTNVWAEAAKEISEAKYIFVIGYSFPESDLFFRYLLALGMLDMLRLKCFWVIDPDPDVGVKFKNLLGTSVQQKFVAHPDKFSTDVVVKKIRSVLEQNHLIERN